MISYETSVTFGIINVETSMSLVWILKYEKYNLKTYFSHTNLSYGFRKHGWSHITCMDYFYAVLTDCGEHLLLIYGGGEAAWTLFFSLVYYF